MHTQAALLFLILEFYELHLSLLPPLCLPTSFLFTLYFPSTSPTFRTSLPNFDSPSCSKLPVLFPYPAPAVDPLPSGVALEYGAVSACEPKRKMWSGLLVAVVASESEEVEEEEREEEGKEERLLPGRMEVERLVRWNVKGGRID